MQVELLELDGEPARLAQQLRDLIPAADTVQSAVAEIIAEVRAHGDEALLGYTSRFDLEGGDPPPLVVSEAELERAAEQLSPDIKAGLELGVDNVRRVGEAWGSEAASAEFTDHQVNLRSVPVDRAAVYVPGGRAPYPSTVVMGVVTAKVAGVPEVVVCAPPRSDGHVDPAVMAACRLSGADALYAMGGAQAIAALAYGTRTVAAVDVIVGPGNLYVQEAKRQVFGQVGIDGFAGPSDLVIIADEGVDATPIALDLRAQAEHGPGTLVLAISASRELLETLAGDLHGAPDTGAVARLVQAAEPADQLELAERLAPEHLQLIGARAEQLADRITHAGCLFVGPASGTAFGDYIAGSNHILPTGGAARFSSGLNPGHFRRNFAEVRVGDGSRLARAAAPVARAEGFEAHARSMEARIRDNEADEQTG